MQTKNRRIFQFALRGTPFCGRLFTDVNLVCRRARRGDPEAAGAPAATKRTERVAAMSDIEWIRQWEEEHLAGSAGEEPEIANMDRTDYATMLAELEGR